MDNLEDYFLREKLAVYYPTKDKINKKYENDNFVRAFEEFLLEEGPLSEYEIIYPDDYPEGTHAILNEKGRFFDGQEVKTEKAAETKKTSFFSNEGIIQSNDTVEDLDISDDLLILDTDEGVSVDNLVLDNESELSSIDQLMLLEMEDGDLFGDTSAYYYFETDLNDDNTSKIDQEDVIEHPEKYIKMYESFSSNVRISADKLIINFFKVNSDVREQVKAYLNTYKVDKDTLGSLEVIIKIGNNLNSTGIYVKGYDIQTLQNLFVA